MQCPLSKLGNDPGLVTARHEKLTGENGSYIANGCMRTLRAIYNHARKTARALPTDNPVSAVDWNAEYRRDTALGLGDLSGWFAAAVARGCREPHLRRRQRAAARTTGLQSSRGTVRLSGR